MNAIIVSYSMLLAVLLLLSGNAAFAGQAELSIRKGATALDKNQLVQAQAHFEQATRAAPENAGAWLLLAQTYAKQKKQGPALNAARQAEKFAGADADVLHGLAYFYTQLQRDLKKAATLEARYAGLRPQDRSAWTRVASLYLEAGETDQAIAAARRGLANNKTAELHSLLGAAHLKRKEWDLAAAEMKEAVALSPYDEQAHFKLAQVYLMRPDFLSAAAVLENARKTFDKSPQIELALGVAYYGLRKFSQAVDQFLKVMDLSPNVPQPYVFLGRILEHAHDRLPEVTRRFAQFNAGNPNNPLGYVLHAKALIAQLPPAGDPPEASTASALLEKALALKDDDADAHLQTGILLERKRDFAKAASHLERSVELNPNEPAAHYRLARVYTRLGRTEDAARERALHEKLSEQDNTARPLQPQ